MQTLLNPISCSFFPAGLSLVIELMFTKAGRPQWDVKQIIKSLPTDEVQNPVVYRLENRDDSMTRTLDTHLVFACRVRVIAMTCLVVVHTLCRFAVSLASP
jgi:hypothetical protein